MTNKFNPTEFESKWIQKWEETQVYKTSEEADPENKFYCLDMFPYPSGSGLHVGHPHGYLGTDVISRFMRMKGKAVLHPMGFDAFGLPAENFAIKTGTPPQETTDKSIAMFKSQIENIGLSYDWSRELSTHDPAYYKWTQWLFLLLFKNGYAYKKAAPVNWCPKDQTVLANEQVVDGKCERCDTEVVQRNMEQWFFKITAFSDRLIEDLGKIDWPESTKLGQINWIGRSEGTRVKFEIRNSKSENKDHLEIFTTRIDTIFGATFMVIAPEHPMIQKYKDQITNYKEVEDYINATKLKTELERQTNKDKTGVKIEGVNAINPFNNVEVPIFVADYVLMGYGTGAIMAVPAHDERDGEFALKNNLEIKNVISPKKAKYMGYVKRDWSNNFDKFVAGLEAINASFRTKTDNEVIFLFDEDNVDKFVEIASESVRGKRAWHDVLSENEAVVIFGQDDNDQSLVDINHIPKFFEDERVWTKMKNFEEGVRGFKSLWDMLYASDYKEKIFFTDYGVLTNSGDFSDLTSEEAAKKMQAWLIENNLGEAKITYRLRDWLVSRQRYWGAPIPIVYCEKCKSEGKGEKEDMPGLYSVPEDQLPVILPTDVNFLPTGESPIAMSKAFNEGVKCPNCGGQATREADTMDTFVDSSWYFFRYADVNNDKAFASKEKMQQWLPVDLYVGGAEHTVLHLLYSRFFTKVLFDLGYISFDEPFKKLRHQGTILAPDGRKMSKRWGNVINPDDEIEKYGADTLRVYEMFMGPFPDSKPWNTKGEVGVYRFMVKVWELSSKIAKEDNIEQKRQFNKIVKKVTYDIENLSFNTAVAKFMEFTNYLSKEEKVSQKVWENFLKLLAPFAPFISEELWSKLGNAYSIHQQTWPEYDEALIQDDTVKIAVQINGKVRSTIEIDFDTEEKDAVERAMADENIKKYVQSEPKKVIFVKNKILNIII